MIRLAACVFALTLAAPAIAQDIGPPPSLTRPEPPAGPPVPTPRPDRPAAAKSGAGEGGAEAGPDAGPGLILEALPPSAPPAKNDPNAAHFVVVGLAPDDLLNLRATASATGMTIGRLSVGATVKNLGCAEVGKYRWCKVGDLDNQNVQGWAAARYLQPIQIDEIEPQAAQPETEPVTGEPGEVIEPVEGESAAEPAAEPTNPKPVPSAGPDATAQQPAAPASGPPASTTQPAPPTPPSSAPTVQAPPDAASSQPAASPQAAPPTAPAAQPAPAAPPKADSPPIRIDCSAPGVICENK